MANPSFDEFIEPLLRVLLENEDGLKAAEAYEETADQVGLTNEDRAELLPSQSQEVYKNRIGWAHDRLKRAGLSHSPRWGVWQLTEKGRRFAEKHAGDLPAEILEQIARPRKHETGESPGDGLAETTDTAGQTPQERIESAVEELYDSVSEQLLTMIHENSDDFFETLVLDVLQAMGYGAGRNAIQHQGGTNDGGIDGIISLDRLGLEKVYVQAKRWRDTTVGRPDVQAFSGALRGNQASKGVFITTSTFSSHAHDFARSVSDSIVLVDGDQLDKPTHPMKT